jgi:hypothetical protein
VELGLLRSDYMVDEPTGALLQVEVNTIASSFACLSALTGVRRRTCARRSARTRLSAHAPSFAGRMHRHVVQRAGLEHAYPLAALPANHALEGMPAGLAAAWKQARAWLARAVATYGSRRAAAWRRRGTRTA